MSLSQVMCGLCVCKLNASDNKHRGFFTAGIYELTFADLQFGKMRPAGFTCLGGSARSPSPSLAGSWHAVVGRWDLIREKVAGEKDYLFKTRCVILDLHGRGSFRVLFLHCKPPWGAIMITSQRLPKRARGF